MFWSSTISEKVIVATPLGPNQPMNRRVARSVEVPSQGDRHGYGAGDEEGDEHQAHGCPAVVEERIQRQQRAEHHEDAELYDLHDLIRPLLEVLA